MAGREFDVTVVMCTYNRCEMLPDALESIFAQDAGGVRYEFIVVDNNSPDRTRAVVESFIERGDGHLRYVFEGKQGLSHARNTGIAQARAPIIAFTDDDVRVAKDWVRNIKQGFDQHPEVDYIGGKVLPMWGGQPPAWLTAAHWSPLATTDYGDEAFYVNAATPRCLVGANLSFRRTVFEEIGLFAPEFQRVKDGIGSTEDHEHQLRIWRAGKQGLYVPSVVVSAEVQADRLTKAYHRRWHTGHGRHYAIMRAADIEQASARLFDVPAHLYRQAFENSFRWLKAVLTKDEEKAFWYETRLRFFQGFFRQRRRDYLSNLDLIRLGSRRGKQET